MIPSSLSGCQDFLWDPVCALKQKQMPPMLWRNSSWSGLTLELSHLHLSSSELHPLCGINVVRASASMKNFTMSLNPVPMATCSLLCSSDTEENNFKKLQENSGFLFKVHITDITLMSETIVYNSKTKHTNPFFTNSNSGKWIFNTCYTILYSIWSVHVGTRVSS